MEVIYKKKFFSDLKDIPPSAQQAVKVVLDKLQIAKSLETANVDYAKMEGQKPGQNYYRIRVGRYRIGVEYLNPDVIVIMIATRGSIYAAFPPK
jgi:mRNA interferase RelE/StbE